MQKENVYSHINRAYNKRVSPHALIVGNFVIKAAGCTKESKCLKVHEIERTLHCFRGL